MLQRCLDAVKAESYQLWLSGEENFRKEIYPLYKANRLDKPRPRHLEPLRQYLVETWGARLTEGYEADDALGIAATELGENCTICSIDKDLLQIPGYHWNFVKEVYQVVNNQQALQRFFTQCLTGDSSDNVKGVSGIGPVKASRIITDGLSEREMFDAVRARFRNDTEFLLTVDLIYILRNEGERWSTMKQSWMSENLSELEQVQESSSITLIQNT